MRRAAWGIVTAVVGVMLLPVVVDAVRADVAAKRGAPPPTWPAWTIIVSWTFKLLLCGLAVGLIVLAVRA